MKTMILQYLFVILVIFASCQKEPIIRIGFDTDFDKSSTGLTVMNVVRGTKSITLTGEIFITEGKLLVQLLNLRGEQAYTKEMVLPMEFRVNESFPAITGSWKLMYHSIEGLGSMRLHLKIEN